MMLGGTQMPMGLDGGGDGGVAGCYDEQVEERLDMNCNQDDGVLDSANVMNAAMSVHLTQPHRVTMLVPYTY